MFAHSWYTLRRLFDRLGCTEPTKAQAEAKGYAALRFPRFKRPTLVKRRLPHLAGDFGVSQAFAYHTRKRHAEPLPIG